MKQASLSIIIPLFFLVVSLNAQTSEFTYQGKLSDSGVAANGSYDMRFQLYDVPSDGTPITSMLERSGVPVTNGTFAVVLDFDGSLFNGADRYLEIAVTSAGGSTYTVLSPRQKILSSPYAIKSKKADEATTATSAANADNASQLGGLPPSRYVQVDQNGTASVSSLSLTSGVVTFPDLTTQSTAGLTSVSKTAPLTGNGTPASPLGIQNPLDVRDLDRPTRQPVNFVAIPDGSTVAYSVPAGKVLVIEYVSTWQIFPKGQLNYLRLGSPGYLAYIPAERCDDSGTTNQICIFGKSLRFYIQKGQSADGGNVRIYIPNIQQDPVTPVYVSGYLVDVP